MANKKKNVTLLDKISFSFDKVLLGNVILDVLFLLLGIVLYSNPFMAMKSAGIVLGILLIFLGLYDIYEFFTSKDTPLFNLNIILGILTIILGFFTIFNPFKLIKFLTMFLGIYLGILAIFRIIQAFKLRKYGFDGWGLMLIMNIIILIFGVFIGINPMAYVEIVEATGIFIILASILEICELLMLYSKSKEILKLIKKNI